MRFIQKLKEPLAFLAIWILGCIIFDAILELTGSWLMLGGAVTAMIGKSIVDGIRSNTP